jgi:hypothetical protein
MASRNALKKVQPHSRQAADRELRSSVQNRKPVLVSSHPDADPEAPVPSEAAIEVPFQDTFRRGPDAERPKPIVSINGNDVETEDSDCDAT